MTSSWFTPACAGKSCSCLQRNCTATVHPRVCGEIGQSPTQPLKQCGSPPRVRGNLASSTTDDHAATVHPRVCGEIDKKQHRLERIPRFTPACAGKSSMAGRNVSATGGSPPRVRGNPVRCRCGGPFQRFTPACAGKSQVRLITSVPVQVHPRVCGEIRLSHLLNAVQSGSPPRVRGNLGNASPAVAVERFTPACAGKSSGVRSDSIVIPVHPRVCGEIRSATKWPRRTSGSPPRVRGNHRNAHYQSHLERFTPACAGKSATSQSLRPG